MAKLPRPPLTLNNCVFIPRYFVTVQSAQVKRRQDREPAAVVPGGAQGDRCVLLASSTPNEVILC